MILTSFIFSNNGSDFASSDSKFVLDHHDATTNSLSSTASANSRIMYAIYTWRANGGTYVHAHTHKK